MIKVIYGGRLGNKLFQYAFARILAHSFGWRMENDPIVGFPATYMQVEGAAHAGPEVSYRGNEIVNLPAILKDQSPRRIVVNACLQRYEYYEPYAALIRDWLQAAPSAFGAFPTAGPNDMVLHLRLGVDYCNLKWILHPDFFEHALAMQSNVDKLYICYDAKERAPAWVLQKCLEPFVRKGAIVFGSDNPITDFNFVRQFRTIATSSSTFCWWAAYLSRAETIYSPDLRQSSTSYWKGQVRLEVNESRYVYLPARTLWDDAEMVKAAVAAVLEGTRERPAMEHFGKKINKATYGANGKTVDVTDLINKLLFYGYNKFLACNELGGDPAIGIVKQLEIELDTGEKKIFKEGEVVVL